MKNCYTNIDVLQRNRRRKTNLKMKLSFVAVFFFMLQLSANSMFSQKKIDLDYKEVPLKTVLDEIKAQTDYHFFYNVNEIDDDAPVTFKVRRETIDKVLSKLGVLADFDFKMNESQIVLTAKSKLTSEVSEQDTEISGTITDKSGTPLPGANVLVKGTTVGAQADFDGKFTLEVPEGKTILEISYIGFRSLEVDITGKDTITVALEEAAAQLDDVVVVGSRGKPRTSFDSPVPVDNLKIAELEATGRGVLDQQLMFKVPSYNSTQQPISDAAAHFSPADLRGLFPSRTLVLVNGKRKNASALVYSYVTPGRGEVGVDMKSVPSAALERVEILRDGAAAQYGSDAVAGVINLVLKKESDPFINTNYSVTTEGDGEQYQIETGFGVKIADKGYANFTFNYFEQKRSQRAGTITSVADEAGYWGISDDTDFSTSDLEGFLQRNPSAGFEVGAPDMTITNFVYNTGYLLDEETNTEIYSFGTLANRSGSSPQFARVPYWAVSYTHLRAHETDSYLVC